MKTGTLCAFFLVLLAWTAQAADVPPQAQPVQKLLEAVKASDVAKLKEVFSGPLKKRLAEIGWKIVLKNYQKGFKDLVGDFEIKDFSFKFEGTKEAGKVQVHHKKKKLPDVSVILESGSWKMNER